jgi:hypothetical protein
MRKETTLPNGCRVSHRGPHLCRLYKKQVHRAVRQAGKLECRIWKYQLSVFPTG